MELLCAIISTQIVTLLIQSLSLLFVVLVVFSIDLEGSFLLVLFVTIIIGIGGMMWGLIISSLARDERSAVQIAMGSILPFLLLSGIIWPIEAIPKGMRVISNVLITTWGAEVMRSIFTRGWGLENEGVWEGILISFAWVLGGFILALPGLRNKD